MGVTFQVLGGALDLQADFERPVFQMLGSPAPLHDRLWTHLARFGLQPSDLWLSQGLGLSSTNLQCNLRSLGVDLKVYVNRAELSCRDLPRISSRELAAVTAAAFGSLHGDEGPKFGTYSLAIGLHGTLDGVTPQAFLSQYTIAPQGPSSSSLVGSGAIFYYGNSAERLSGSLRVDLSGWGDNAVFVRSYSVRDASATPVEGLLDAARHQLEQAALELGIEIAGLPLGEDE
jgi:hypothetical protein